MQSAKYSKQQRVRWYLVVEKDGLSVKNVCQTFGMSRKTYYKWYNHDHGRSDPTYQPPQAQRTTKLTLEIKKFMIKQKHLYNYGPQRMAWVIKREYGVRVSTTIVYRYYKKQGLIRKPQRRYPEFQPLQYHLVINEQGVGVQVDIKYVYPRGRREYLFSVFDPFTEQYFAKVYPSKESKWGVSVFEKAEQFFGFNIQSIQTDNGTEFRGEFHAWLNQQGLPHYFIPKRSPYWNGKVERVHRTVDDEYYQNPFRPWVSFEGWLHWYNYERVHTTLKGLTPKEYALLINPNLPKSVTLDC